LVPRLKRGVFRSIVDLQTAINRFFRETNDHSEPFVWTADPNKIIAAVRGGYQTRLEPLGSIIDTNALVTRLFLPGSISRQAVRKAVAEAQLLASDDTIIELVDVLAREKSTPI
jgi:predicted nucleic-acid-binding protein